MKLSRADAGKKAKKLEAQALGLSGRDERQSQEEEVPRKFRAL